MLKFKKTDLMPLLAAIPADSELLLVHEHGLTITVTETQFITETY